MSFLKRFKEDYSDFYINIIPFGMLMVSIAYAGEAINIYTDDRWESIFEIFQGFFAITIIGVGIPATVYNIFHELKKKKNRSFAAETGFVQTIYNTTAVRGFSFVFIALLITEQFGPILFPDLPAAFFMQAVVSATLMFFSIAFWVEMSKSGGGQSDE